MRIQPNLWTRPAPRLSSPDPRVQISDLGDGVTRLQFSDGSIRLDGLKEHGLPAMARREGAAVRMQIDPDPLWQALTADAPTRGDAQRIELSGGATADSLPAGPQGFQLTRLTSAPGRDAVNVYSQGPLETSTLDNMATAMRELPPDAFKNGRTAIAVVDWTGEFQQEGETLTYGGLTYGDTGRMFLTRDQLKTADDARATVWHESAHILDVAWSRHGHPLSEVARADDGRWLFGHGTYAASQPHAPLYPTRGETTDASRSDYVSLYATSNATEDLAETHAMLMQLDADYRQQHSGQDLVCAEDARAFVEQHHLSKGLTEKAIAILDAYRG